jgi:uncharacterized repeat protein (TIGR03806 family)
MNRNCSAFELMATAARIGRASGAAWAGCAAAVVAGLGCSAGQDETQLFLDEPAADVSSSEAVAFLGLPQTAADSALGPERLSETLAFADVAALEVTPGILPYSVQTPLWSDGAQKQRWMALPSGGHIGFSERGAWTFPEGSVFIKHFGMALDERTPDVVRRLETRFLVAARGGGYFGLVYRWDDDQRDAHLLLDGDEETLQIVQPDGSVREQRYTYPSQRACNACHSEGAGYVRGVRTGQLNGGFEHGDGNQLAAWEARGLFDTPAPETESGEHERLAALGDESAPLEARVRSYWDVNCASCHNAASPLRSWDASFSTPLEAQGVLLAPPHGGPRPDGVRLIVPGDPERSLIYLRSGSLEPSLRMPPLLKNRIDQRYVELLRAWIESLPAQ